jgi:hypothetical protein
MLVNPKSPNQALSKLEHGQELTDNDDLECALAAYGVLEERALARGDKKEANKLREEIKRLIHTLLEENPQLRSEIKKRISK